MFNDFEYMDEEPTHSIGEPYGFKYIKKEQTHSIGEPYGFGHMEQTQLPIKDIYEEVKKLGEYNISLRKHTVYGVRYSLSIAPIKNICEEVKKLQEENILLKEENKLLNEEIEKLKNPKNTKSKKPKNMKSKKKKETIPTAVRIKVWATYIGTDEAKGKCFCCCDKTIYQHDFQCGHIQSEHNGGQVNIQNLRPLCGKCNRSMGTKNMLEFMNQYGFDTNHIS